MVRYSRFKEELAQHFEHTREYSSAKKPFVKEMEQMAIQWFEENEKKSI